MRRSLVPITVAAGLAMAGGPVHATGGILGLSAGANLWYHQPSGTQEFAGESFDIDDDFGLNNDRDGHIWLQWDHFVPVIPSVRLERTGLSEDGTGEINLAYGDVVAGAEVKSVVDLEQTDLTLYWTPIPMPFVDFDIGITGKHIDGEITVENRADEAQRESVTFSGTLPMLFGRVGIDIPGTRIRSELSIKSLDVGDHSIRDTQFMVAYKWWYAGAMVGYRDISVDLDDFDDVTVDISFNGPFAGFFLRF